MWSKTPASEEPKVCSECGVYYQPHSSTYPSLCKPHSNERLTERWREARIIKFALMNADSLEPQITAWEASQNHALLSSYSFFHNPDAALNGWEKR